MFGLETSIFVLLLLCLSCACIFEFVNGFHDTANAVATVIYTNSLKPTYAVVWAGIWNFIGVLFGGVAVAMGIVNLLPIELLIDQNVYHSVAMILALLISAIIWNLGTWYFGLPASSSHTLIGSIIGVGLGYMYISGKNSVNWDKAQEIGLSLLLSPLAGFSLAIILMFVMRRTLDKDIRKQIFSEPEKSNVPPLWIRATLITTCTLVSFFHGNNDGQKGVGLVMLILIGITPAYFAIDTKHNTQQTQAQVAIIEGLLPKIDTTVLSVPEREKYTNVALSLTNLKQILPQKDDKGELPSNQRMNARKEILTIATNVKKLANSEAVNLSDADKDSFKTATESMRKLTDYSPDWVVLMISLALGLGTMVGWKRIVVTVGEKIGKQHLTYAQGASAELVAATMIGVASASGLPVSTTHVLSSGIAGSMVASKGVKNLQASTIRNIALAWVLTLPVTIILSATLFILFRAIL